MVRAPSYDFERRERHKAKAAKRAEKASAKAQKKGEEAGAASEGAQAQQTVDETEVAGAGQKLTP
jgi:hypothetical protein